MEYQSEQSDQPISTAAEGQAYPLSDLEASKQVLEDFKELREEELLAVAIPLAISKLL